MKCKSMPLYSLWDEWRKREQLGKKHEDEGEVTGVSAQHVMMEGFVARGAANPEKTVTQRGFREHLMKGIIQDDLPYSLGEKPVMQKLLHYLLPCGFTIPSHQTVRRDLDKLYSILNNKLNTIMKVCSFHSSHCHLLCSTLQPSLFSVDPLKPDIETHSIVKFVKDLHCQ